MDVCSNHWLEEDAVFSLVQRSQTAGLFFTALLCDLNETRTEIGLMNPARHSDSPPFTHNYTGQVMEKEETGT